jgi:hypothetical protein
MGANDKADTEPGRTARRIQGVEDENVRTAAGAMPGQRADLPKDTLPGHPSRPQADENRDQPVAPDGKLTVPSKPPLTD